MRKIDNNTYIVGGNTIVRTQAKGKKEESHSPTKINDSSELGNEGWCDWGDDNQYPKTLMQKMSKIGAAVGGLEVLCSAHYGVGLKSWHSSLKSGWVDVVLSVPELKKMMFEQQFNFKYLVHIADDYFSHRYGKDEWAKFDNQLKEQYRADLVKAIDEEMSGNKGAGKSLISPFFRDASGGLVKGIQIEPIEQPQANGEFLPDASAGNSEILFAMGVDPCLLGAGVPGGKNLSGSGSDKREAWTILSARLPRKHIHTLAVFRNIQKWNGWNTDYVARFPNINLTTLDKNKNGQEKIVQ